MILLIYLILINIITFFVFGADKRKARKGRWRVPEAALFFLSAIGGSAGALAGMRVFRHKTRKSAFKFGIPLIFILQIALAVFLVIVL